MDYLNDVQPANALPRKYRPGNSTQLITEIMRRKRENEVWLVAAAAMFGANTYAECSWLRPEEFSDEQCRKFWEMFLKYSGDGRRAMIEQGLEAEFTHWVAAMPTNRPDVFASEIQRLGVALEMSTGILTAFKSLTAGDVEASTSILRGLVDISETRGRPGRVKSSGDIGMDFMDHLEKGWDGFSSGFPKLDGVMGVFVPGDLTTLAARTSVGKTALAWQIANQVVMSGRKALYISNEQSAVQLWARRAAGNAHVDWRKVMAGQASPEELDRIRDCTVQLMDVLGDRLRVDDQSQTLAEIHQSVSASGADLVVLDHLDEIPMPKGVDSKVDWLGQVISAMRRMAKQFHCHVIVVHQLSRKLEDRSDHTPTLADLRWSGDIEQKSDIVLLLHRPDLYGDNETKAAAAVAKPSGACDSLVEVWIAKNRSGPRDALCRLWYDTSTQWFGELAPAQRVSLPISKLGVDVSSWTDK